MKPLLVSSLLALALVGCSTMSENKAPKENVSSTQPAQTQVINFTGPMDLVVTLKSSDNFETAEMTDNSDRVYKMKQVPAASGVRLESNDGASIHFKGSEGMVEFVKGKPIEIKEFKK